MNQQELKNTVKDSILEVEFIQDSGHGWLKIPKELAFNLDYSNYSYSDGKFLFLGDVVGPDLGGTARHAPAHCGL